MEYVFEGVLIDSGFVGMDNTVDCGCWGSLVSFIGVIKTEY